MGTKLKIKIDDLKSSELAQFLQQHINDMQATSPPESKHALDLSGLKQKDITFWSAYHEDVLVACGALKELNSDHAEIKSMRTSTNYRGKGFASEMLQYIIDSAKTKNSILEPK